MQQSPSGEQAAEQPRDQRSFWWRRFSPPNPFYLLSAAFVVHGTGLSIYDGDGLPPELLFGLVGGYVLLMAVIALLIVRCWNVWDDARSILLIALLLFVELALIADSTLLTEPSRGMRLLVIGLATAVIAGECVLRGLKLPLPFRFRGPFYVQLGLLFFYPLLLLGPLRAAADELIAWGLFGFPVACGVSLYLLIPAVRRGAAGLERGRGGWAWPWYPWTLFVFFGGCLMLRSYTLCLSFDPVTDLSAEAAYRRMENIFGPHFLIPPLYAACWLVMEAAVLRRRHSTRLVALGLPVACLLLAFPGTGKNAVEADFMAQFVQRLGSPAWVTLIGLAMYYGVARLRGLKDAGRPFLIMLLGLAVLPTNAVHPSDFVGDAWSPRPSLLTIAATVAAARGWRRRSSLGFLETAAYGIAALWSAGVLDGWPVPAPAIAGHLLLLAVLAVGAALDDRLARILREAGALLLAAAAAGGMGWTLLVAGSTWEPPLYSMTAALLAAALGWRLQHLRFWYAAVINLVLAYSAILWEGFQTLHEQMQWAGLKSFAVGLILLHLGLLVSACKGGGLRSAHEQIVRFCQRE